MLALVTAQLFLFAGNREDYLSNAGKIIANNFLPEGYLSSKDAKNGYNTFYFDNCADIVTHIAWTVGQYYRLKDKAPTYLELTGRDGHGSYSLKPHGNTPFMTDRKSNKFGVQKLSIGPSDKQQLQNSIKKQLYLQEIFEKKKLGSESDEDTAEVPATLSHDAIPNPVEMLISRYTNMSLPIQNFQKKLNKDTTSDTFFLSVNDTFGPFTPFVDPDQPKIISDQEDVKIIDPEGLQKYILTFTEITLKFTYKNIFTQGTFPELLIWDIALSYDFSTGAGVIPVTLRYDVGLGLENEQDFNAANVLSSPLTWISILIIVFALFSLFLIFRAIYRSFRFIKKAMKKDRSIFQMMLMESTDDMDETEQKSVDLHNSSVLSESTPLVGINNSSPQTKPVAVKNAKKRFDEEMNESYGSAISGMTFTSQYYQHVLDKHQSELHQLQTQKEEEEDFTPSKKVHLPGIPFRIVTGEIGVPTPEHIIAAKAELSPNFTPKLKHKLKFFNPWHVLGIISNLFCIVSSCMVFTNVTYQYFSLDATNILLGLSAIFMWANIVQYLSHSPKFYVLIKSLRKGLPNIGRFIIGAAPLLIGYALCGMVLFGSYTESFQGFQNSLITLFSAANGDALIDTFNSLFGQNSVIAYFSRIYLVTFVCLFTYSVINIFILIMEDAYFSVKEANIKKEAAEAAAQAIEEFKKGGKGGAGSQNQQGGNENDTRSDSMFNDAGSWKKGGQNDEDDDVERLQDERSKIDVLINLLSELRSGQLLGEGEEQDPQNTIQQKNLSEKLTRLLVNRNLKKIRRKKSDPYMKSALSSSFKKFEVGSFGEKKKKETKFNLDLNESIDDGTLIEVYDEDDEMASPTPPNL